MVALAFSPGEPVFPTEADAAVAGEAARQLAPILANAAGTILLKVGDSDDTGEAVAIPTAAFRLLVTTLTEMAAGNAVCLISHRPELTTQEAAGLLNVSRPFVVKLLEEGTIPSRLVGKHRRVLLRDVIAYRDEHYRARSDTLDQLAAIDQELGLT